MIRTYSILATSRELQTSPYINKLQKRYDVVLTTNEPQVVNFLFQLPISREDAHQVHALYDHDQIEVTNTYVDCFQRQTLLSVTLIAKDVGSMQISFTVPDHLSLPGEKLDTAATSR